MQNFNKIVFFDIDDTLFDTATFIKTNQTRFIAYQDVEQTLSRLLPIAQLGIFSQGDLMFQKEKLKQTQIENFFPQEHTYIVADKQAEFKNIVEKYHKTKKVFFVEDRLPILYAIHQEFPQVFTIWVKRGRYAPSQPAIEGFSPSKIVEDFPDIVAFIESK